MCYSPLCKVNHAARHSQILNRFRSTLHSVDIWNYFFLFLNMWLFKAWQLNGEQRWTGNKEKDSKISNLCGQAQEVRMPRSFQELDYMPKLFGLRFVLFFFSESCKTRRYLSYVLWVSVLSRNWISNHPNVIPLIKIQEKVSWLLKLIFTPRLVE